MEQAQATLQILCEWAVIAVNAMALLIAFGASAQAFVLAAGWTLSRRAKTLDGARAIWIRYARWLVAALTFQLAADIIETTVAPGWEQIGNLAAIAVVRTFLNYFLARDIREMGGVDEQARHVPIEAGRAARQG